MLQPCCFFLLLLLFYLFIYCLFLYLLIVGYHTHGSCARVIKIERSSFNNTLGTCACVINSNAHSTCVHMIKIGQSFFNLFKLSETHLALVRM